MKLACRKNDRTSSLLVWADYGLRPADDVDYLIRRYIVPISSATWMPLKEVSRHSSGLLSDVEAAIERPCTVGARPSC